MNVTRNRVRRPARRGSSRTRKIGVIVGAVTLAATGGVAYGTTIGFDNNEVGTEYADVLQISSDQILKPLGERLVTPYGKFMGSTVSPDGRFLAATANDRSVSLQVFDLASYQLIWRGGTAAGVNQRLTDNTVGQEGPLYSPDGRLLWMPNASGLTRFPVNTDGTLGSGTRIAIPNVGGLRALTSGLTYSPDGSTLYAGLNGQNSVVAIDPATGAITRSWDVGGAPPPAEVRGQRALRQQRGRPQGGRR